MSGVWQPEHPGVYHRRRRRDGSGRDLLLRVSLFLATHASGTVPVQAAAPVLPVTEPAAVAQPNIPKSAEEAAAAVPQAPVEEAVPQETSGS